MAGRSQKARQVAMGGILTALSLVSLYLASLTPTGQLGVVAIAGFLPAAAAVSGGLPTGAICYAATGMLGLLIVPDKGGVLLFLLLFGLYPLVKSLIERMDRLPLEWVCKIVFFNAALTVAWFFLRTALLTGLPDFFGQFWFLYLIGNLVFVIYDIGLSKIITFYTNRIDRAIRRP